VFVLLHSPLVGSLTWQPAADLLRARGRRVVVPSLAGVLDAGPPYYAKLAAKVAEAVRAARHEEPLVLIGHSGAGALLPSVAAACAGAIAAAVFVDAILPHPGASWLETAPPPLRDHVLALAVGRWLPPWHRWFPPATLEALLPDPGLRSRFIAELPRTPVGYFEEAAPRVLDQPRRCGYLQLSGAYRAMADEAERRGWPTRREAADHLAMLTRPAVIADRLVELVQEVVR